MPDIYSQTADLVRNIFDRRIHTPAVLEAERYFPQGAEFAGSWEAIRDEALTFGFPKDEFVDHRNRPYQIYVRQGRRIWGEATLTERDASRDWATALDALPDLLAQG